MDGTVSIRVAGEADFDALTDLWERSARSSHAFMGDEVFAQQRPRVRDLLLPSMDVWVAETSGEKLGFVGAREDVVELLYVAPEAQGRGLGPALLSYVDGGAGPHSVEVYADNTVGVAFYRGQGFVEQLRYAVTVGGGTFEVMRLTRSDR
jgi:putative acetyltransferase